MRVGSAHPSQPRLLLWSASVFFLAFFLFSIIHSDTNAAVWKESSGFSPPGGNAGIPLNISRSTQTKTGPLTLTNGLTIQNPSAGTCQDNPLQTCSTNQDCVTAGAGSLCIPHPDLVVTGRICWNGDCRNNWADAAGIGTEKPVHVFNVASQQEVGYAEVQGPAADPANPRGAINVTAASPGVLPTNAVWASSSDDSLGRSYAIYAQAGASTVNNIALYGIAPANSSAWAGYFAGHVNVASPYDVLVGGSAPPNNDLNGELCISDECKSEWPAVGGADSYWNDTGSIIHVIDSAWDLAIGDDDQSAPFYVLNIPTQASVDVTAKGTGFTLSTLDIGSP